MAGQDWLRPEVPVEAAGTAWAGTPQSQFELRPLSLGEILDRTFALYRSRFWLFAGISMIAAAVNVVGQALSLAAAHKLTQQVTTLPPHASTSASLSAAGGLSSGYGRQCSRVPGDAAVCADFGRHACGHGLCADAGLPAPADRRQAGPGQGAASAGTGGSASRFGRARVLPGSLRPRFRWASCSSALAHGQATLGLVRSAESCLCSGNPGRISSGGHLLPAQRLGCSGCGRGGIDDPAGDAPQQGAWRRAPRAASSWCSYRTLPAGGCGRPAVACGLLMVLSPNKAALPCSRDCSAHYLCGTYGGRPGRAIGLTLVYFDQRVRKEALDLELLLEGARSPAGFADASALGARLRRRAMPRRATADFGPLRG